MSTLLCYDAINTLQHNIPVTAPAIAYYGNGNYAWTQEQVNLYPTRFKNKIDVLGESINNEFDVLDVETGDATPDMTPDWIDRNPRGGIYCNSNNWRDVLDAMHPRYPSFFKYWIADGNSSLIFPGSLARQYGYLQVYDLSIFDIRWWQSGTLVKPSEDEMVIVAYPNQATCLVNGSSVKGMTQEQLNAFVADFPEVPIKHVSASTYSLMTGKAV